MLNRALDRMFEAIDVMKQFGQLRAVDGVTLKVPPGQTTVLLGPSGCGKSTLLRLLLGVLEPTSGEVLFDGEPWRSEFLISNRRQIGFVPQGGLLFPHLTAEQNIRLPADCAGRPKNQSAERAGQLCDLVQLPRDTLKRFPNELSGGQRGRVAIARGLILDPPAVVLDEPMAALDPLVRYDLQQDLIRIFDQLQKTVILVTHDLQEASRLASVVVLMQKGKIVQQGSFGEFVEAPATPFVKTFFQAQNVTHTGPLGT